MKGQCVMMGNYKVIKPYRLLDYDIKRYHLFIDDKSKDLWSEDKLVEYQETTNPNYVTIKTIL